MRLVVTCARFARLTKACGAWLSLDALRANPANPRTIHSERTWNPLPTSPRTFARNHLPRAELHRTRNPPPKPAPKPTLNSTWNLPEPVRDTPCPARNRFRNSLDPSELERFQTQTGRNLFWYPPSTPLPRLPEPRTCPDPPGTCARTCPGTCQLAPIDPRVHAVGELQGIIASAVFRRSQASLRLIFVSIFGRPLSQLSLLCIARTSTHCYSTKGESGSF